MCKCSVGGQILRDAIVLQCYSATSPCLGWMSQSQSLIPNHHRSFQNNENVDIQHPPINDYIPCHIIPAFLITSFS